MTETSGLAKSTIRRRVRLITLLTDNLTDQVIKNKNVLVRIDGERAPIHKPEGYYVFTRLSGDGGILRIESPLYEPVKVPFKLQADFPVFLRLRLTPGRAYPLGKAISVEGKAASGDRISLVWKEKKQGVRLLESYQGGGGAGGTICLDLPKNPGLEGKLMYIESAQRTDKADKKQQLREQGAPGEFFTIWEPEERSQKIDRPLSGHYEKNLSLAYPAYQAIARENGEFYLAAPGCGQKAQEYLCIRDSVGKGIACRKVYRRFIAGTGNKLDFEEE